jgi:hypothetical protein
MPYLLIPPIVMEGPAGGGPLFERFKIPRGVSLLVSAAGGVTEVRYPTEDDLAAADVAYIGGHEYYLSDEDAQPLITAGFASCLTPVDEDGIIG